MIGSAALKPPGETPGGIPAGEKFRRSHELGRDPHEFLVTFLPSETRVLKRTGIDLHRLSYWSDDMAPYVGRNLSVRVYYDPRSISRVYVRLPSGVLSSSALTTPNVPDMSLGEWSMRRHAERRECKSAARVAAKAQSAQRSHAIVVSAQARRRVERRRASAAAGDVWRTEASLPAGITSQSAIDSDSAQTSQIVDEMTPTVSAPIFYAIEENDDEL